MKFRTLSSLMAFALLSFSAHAKKSEFIRGGQGFLFPDHNSFVNPGQLARNTGFGMQLAYQTQELLGTHLQSGEFSLSHSGKKMSFGVAATRSGVSFNDSASDSVDTGIGFNLGKRVTFGVRYQRGIGSGQSDDGDATATFNLNPGRKGGVTFGAGYHTSLGGATTVSGATVGFGYTNKKATSAFEANANFPDLNSTDAYIASAHGVFSSKRMYTGLSFVYNNILASALSSARARIGFLMGKKAPWDLSLFTTYTFDDAVEPLFGLTVRAAL